MDSDTTSDGRQGRFDEETDQVAIGQEMLHRALRKYRAPFHQEHNHQGFGKVLIMLCASRASAGVSPSVWWIAQFKRAAA